MTLLAFLNILKLERTIGLHSYGICSPGRQVDEVERAGIPVFTVQMTRRITPLQDLLSLIQLTRLLTKKRPDIIHTHTPKANLLGQWAAWIAGIPIRVATVHGLYFTPMTPWHRRFFFKWIERISGLPAQKVWLINREDVRTAKKLSLYTTEKIGFLEGGMGIDLARFNPECFDRETRREIRQELGWDLQHFVVGYVGRLVREKGVLELFEAIANLREKNRNLRLLVVGPVDHEKPDSITERAAQTYAIEDICVFTGMRTDVERLYLAMDVFALPSHREGLPRSAMEAQAMGVPVVTTDARGCSEVVQHGRGGILVPAGNAQALADGIKELAVNREKAQRMGKEARLWALGRFDERLTSEKINTEYVRLLSERGLPLPRAKAYVKGALE
jgi:glycosyltransferase involved in cell wall biosynthesis